MPTTATSTVVWVDLGLQTEQIASSCSCVLRTLTLLHIYTQEGQDGTPDYGTGSDGPEGAAEIEVAAGTAAEGIFYQTVTKDQGIHQKDEKIGAKQHTYFERQSQSSRNCQIHAINNLMGKAYLSYNMAIEHYGKQCRQYGETWKYTYDPANGFSDSLIQSLL